MDKFDSLLINNFRGVMGELALDLSSPLTVIYAPNGTGKTTTLQAAEWLLTGRVESKRVGACRTNYGSLCHNICNENIKVDVSCRIGATTIKFIDNAWTLSGSGPISHEAYLETQLPGIFANNFSKSDSKNEFITSWLYGAHFFYQDSVNFFLNKEYAQLREEFFRDLTGVRYFSEIIYKAKQLIKIANKKMDSNIEIQARKTRDIEELTNELAHSSLTSSNHAIEEVKDCIHDCGSLLKSAMPPSNDESLDALRDSFRTIIEKCESEKTDYNKSIDSLAAIENYDVNRTITADNKTENIKLKKKLIEDRTNLKQTHDNLRKIIGDAKLSLHQIESGYNNYSQMSMMLTSCISSIINTNQAYQQMQLGQAFRLAPQYKLSSQAIADNKNELNNLISKYHREIENYHYFKDSIQKKIAELSKTVTANNPKFLLQEKRLKQESIVRDNLKAKLTTLGGVLSQFQIFTKSSLPYLKNAEHCPTCGHKWESSTALEKAINTTCTTDKSHLTVKINYLNNQINSKNNLITEIENFITIANSQREELARLKDEAYSRERRWSEYIASVKKATPNFVDGDLFENLNSAIKHYTIANELSIIWHNNAFIQQAIGNNNIHEFTMLNLKLALESALTDGHAQFELEFGNAKKSLNLSTAELETIEMKLAQISADIERIDKIVKQANREKINIEEAWRILAPGKEFTADNLKNVWDEQRENENRLNALSEEIKRANFIFDTIPKFVKLEELKNEISAAKNKETKIENTLRSAKSIIRFHEDLFNNKMLSQIISLENIINVLFLRMQVNFVYNGIKFDRDGQQPIIRKICACSGHTEVDPETYFSRGQRQDLALAIFLARAIAIGGTFFLDEPFAHLDDLNRVAMIDILRVLTIQHKDKINLVVTTASDQLVDLITSKFTNVPHQKNCASPLTVYQLSGNPRIGTEAEKFCYGLPV